MYRDGTPCVGVLAPHVQLGLQSSPERRRWLGFHVLVCMRVLIVALVSHLIFIDHANGFHHRRSISIPI
jgi:hypothetical protein